MQWLAGLALLAGALSPRQLPPPRAEPGGGPWRMQKDLTDYALWRLPVGPVPAGTRFVSLDVRFPEGTLFSVWLREAGPRGQAWGAGFGYTVFTSDWHRCIFSIGPFPGPRAWVPVSDAPLIALSATEADDGKLPPKQLRFVMGDGRLALDQLTSVEIEFPSTNGWTGPARPCTYEVRNLRLLSRSPREELLAGGRPVTVQVDGAQDLGALNPLWRDACLSSKSLRALGQRMYKVFGAATFGMSYPPQKGPDDRYNWWGVDAQMRLAQQCAPVIQVVIGRDVPPWLWQPTEVLAKAGPPAIPWKPGHLLPPSDYAAYEEIVYQLARHIREELGLRVHSYLIWGGADARGYFRGTMDDYCRVYETCARAIKRADPDAQVGGPSPDPLFDPDWPRALIEFCGRGGVPLDFVSLHNYSLYPDQSRLAAEWTRRELERYPELRSAEVHFDEWNSGFGFGDVLMGFKRGPMNAAYAAATFIEMAEGGVAYACYACPEEGWGLFGVPLEEKDGTPRAIYNAYRLFSRLEGRRCGVAVSEPESGLRALAATTGGRLQVILCGYGAEQQPAETPLPVAVQVEVAGVSGLDGDRTAALWRVDATHANMLAGKDRAELAPPEAVSLRVEAGRADLSIAMSVPSVVLLEIGTG